jgi:carbonic anhydrase
VPPRTCPPQHRCSSVAAIIHLAITQARRPATIEQPANQITRLTTLSNLFDNNRKWAAHVTADQPKFFERLAAQQSPQYLWIGCSDSRVPANEIVDLLPGELYVHRNVANVVVHSDLNCLSVIQYAVDVLHVKHIIVCGHYGCGGVHAALRGDKLGLIDNWLRHVADVRNRHHRTMDALDVAARADRLCELNVIEQARHVAETTIVRDAWARGLELTVHAWVYGLKDGLLRDLAFTIGGSADVESEYRAAVRLLAESHAAR